VGDGVDPDLGGARGLRASVRLGLAAASPVAGEQEAGAPSVAGPGIARAQEETPEDPHRPGTGVRGDGTEPSLGVRLYARPLRERQALNSLSIVDEWTRECLAIEVAS